MEQILGTKLAPAARKEALARFVHRHMHSMRKLTDEEWLACTRFYVNRDGNLSRRHRHCESNHPDMEAQS